MDGHSTPNPPYKVIIRYDVLREQREFFVAESPGVDRTLSLYPPEEPHFEEIPVPEAIQITNLDGECRLERIFQLPVSWEEDRDDLIAPGVLCKGVESGPPWPLFRDRVPFIPLDASNVLVAVQYRNFRGGVTEFGRPFRLYRVLWFFDPPARWAFRFHAGKDGRLAAELLEPRQEPRAPESPPQEVREPPEPLQEELEAPEETHPQEPREAIEPEPSELPPEIPEQEAPPAEERPRVRKRKRKTPTRTKIPPDILGKHEPRGPEGSVRVVLQAWYRYSSVKRYQDLKHYTGDREGWGLFYLKGNEHLARVTGLSTRTIKRALAMLRIGGEGWSKRGPGGSNPRRKKARSLGLVYIRKRGWPDEGFSIIELPRNKRHVHVLRSEYGTRRARRE